GIVFESKKLYDNKIPGFIINYLKDREIGIETQTAQLLTDYLGNDLSKITNELDKLAIALPEGNKRVTSEIIEQNIGISKDFNNFELQRAIALGDVLKANRIAQYFERNPKNNPYTLSLSVLFAFFSNLMICHFEKNKSKDKLMPILGIRNAWDPRLNDYFDALRRYNAFKVMDNIALIREYDAKGKGFENPATPAGKLLIELIYKLMH
ncbi:MAG: DNA polymerase III subunit delta, partial [Candidatus Symbiothrix sp.]|nr:DNA polymerase III subunit delta [Candidatus Symbiothrix sp.]